MPKKPVTPLKKGDKRTSKAEIELRVSKVMELLGKGLRTSEILSKGSKEFGVAESTVAKYLKSARENIKQMYTEDIKEVRDTKLAGLEKDRDEAYKQYQMADDTRNQIKWFEVYQSVKKTIREFYPDLIQEEQNDEGLSITMRYNPKRDK